MTTETLRIRIGDCIMDKNVAVAILSLAKSVDDVIAKMYSEVENITDIELKSRFNRSVGDLMGYVARDFIFPIERLYPDLKSDD